MLYLNIIYFLILTIYGYKFLMTDGKIVKGALNEEDSYNYSGTELFWCLTFATGLFAFYFDAGINLMALRLLVLEIFCIIGLKISHNKPIISFPLKIYIVYLIWILIGCFYSAVPLYGVRTLLKYLYPLLLCLFASSVVRDSEVFFKSSLLARKVAVISLIVFIPYMQYLIIPGVFWYQTAHAINLISIMILSLGLFYFTNKKKKNFFYTVLFSIPCFIWILRTSMMGMALAVMAFYLIKYKIKAVPIIAGIFVLGVVAVFTIPTLKEKMFYDDSVTIKEFTEGKIDEDNINTNTRKAMWEHLEGKFYEPHKIAGSGTGTVQAYMYASSNNKIFGGLKVPHSDFVQQKCDNGLIGLILYGAIAFFVFVDAFHTYWRYDEPALQLCAIVAGASMIGVYATLYSDNVVNYSMATLSMPFGFYGMMLGLRRHADTQED